MGVGPEGASRAGFSPPPVGPPACRRCAFIRRPPPPRPSAGIAVGFYGNGETSDGIHRATYSLRHANRTVAGVQDRVSGRLMGRGGLCSCP